MACSFDRIGAVTQMKVGDYFIQGRRRRIRVHEKGGKEYDIIAQHLNDLDFRYDEKVSPARPDEGHR